MTERYRLALIAHHAEKLVELIYEQDEEGKVDWWFAPNDISPYKIMTFAQTINEHLNEKEETK